MKLELSFFFCHKESLSDNESLSDASQKEKNIIIRRLTLSDRTLASLKFFSKYDELGVFVDMAAEYDYVSIICLAVVFIPIVRGSYKSFPS